MTNHDSSLRFAAGKTFDIMAYPMRKHGITDEAATLHLLPVDGRFQERQPLEE
jgi:hypothetical protein